MADAVVCLVSTPFEIKLPGMPPQMGFARRWLKLPERLDEALRDVEEGRANGVDKVLQRFTAEEIDRLASVKHRLAAQAEAGL